MTQEDSDKYRVICNPDGSVWTFDTLKEARNGLNKMEGLDIECSIIKLNLNKRYE